MSGESVILGDREALDQWKCLRRHKNVVPDCPWPFAVRSFASRTTGNLPPQGSACSEVHPTRCKKPAESRQIRGLCVQVAKDDGGTLGHELKFVQHRLQECVSAVGSETVCMTPRVSVEVKDRKISTLYNSDGIIPNAACLYSNLKRCRLDWRLDEERISNKSHTARGPKPTRIEARQAGSLAVGLHVISELQALLELQRVLLHKSKVGGAVQQGFIVGSGGRDVNGLNGEGAVWAWMTRFPDPARSEMAAEKVSAAVGEYTM